MTTIRFNIHELENSTNIENLEVPYIYNCVFKGSYI